MEANKILQSDVLDVLFDGRNKEYGAYELRKHYNRRLWLALTAMAVVTTLTFTANYFVQRSDGAKKQVFYVKDVQLEEIHAEKKNEPPPPPPPKTIPPSPN